MSWNPTQNYQNAGLMVYEDDDNYIKTGMVWNGSTAPLPASWWTCARTRPRRW